MEVVYIEANFWNMYSKLLAMGEKIIIGNWKMYKTIKEAEAFVMELLPFLEEIPSKPYLAVPFTVIAPLAELAKGSKLKVGAQNMHDASQGAFTGEIALSMLVDAGAQFVLLGHSERRRLFGETDALIRKKLERTEGSSLQPVLCIGETQEERQLGRTEEVLRRQLFEALEGLSLKELIVAYEPVWAIGTGLSATPREAEEAHILVKRYLHELFGENRIPVLYGGSVNPANAQLIAKEADIDGLLVGGASLTTESFKQILTVGSL